MDLEFDDPRPRYRLCQLGFGLTGLALALLSFDTACGLALQFTHNPGLHALMVRREWIWLVGAPITWASLIGSFFLWGRWSEPTWQRRAGLLLLMNTVDLVSWTLSHAHLLGLAEAPVGHDWLRGQASLGLGWLELMLIAALATDLSHHLGKGDAPEAGRSARSLTFAGFGLWAFLCFTQTDWNHWPLQPRPFRPQSFLLYLGGRLLIAIASFQVTVLCALAARQCKRFVGELNSREWDNDLLRSRSETEQDDFPGSSPTRKG